MMRLVLIVLGSLACFACTTTVNPVTFKPDADMPTLPERAEGCAVESFDENQTPERPHKVFGRIELTWSQRQLEEQGPEGAMKTLRSAVCERGGHYILNLRALPRGFKEGMHFEGDVAYIVDDNGLPLMGVATGSATSKDSAGGSPTPAPATP